MCVWHSVRDTDRSSAKYYTNNIKANIPILYDFVHSVNSQKSELIEKINLKFVAVPLEQCTIQLHWVYNKIIKLTINDIELFYV